MAEKEIAKIKAKMDQQIKFLKLKRAPFGFPSLREGVGDGLNFLTTLTFK